LVLMLTSDSGLVRLARSILEPDFKVSAVDFFGASSTDLLPAAADVVVAQLDGFDPDTLAAVRRTWSGAALIAVSQGRRELDCIAALDMDVDYLAQPFSRIDLAARVRVAERRRFAATGQLRYYRNGPLVFDLVRRKLSIAGRPLALAPGEQTLLARLAAPPGVVVGYAELLSHGGTADVVRGMSALRSCVLRLRRKIEREPLHPEILLAEIGVGYRLAPPGDGFASDDYAPAEPTLRP
jgi:two-component system KDP operon response regulator KdpE